MGFSLSRRSEQELVGVRDPLVAVVRRAITITPVDFTVLQGLRTKQEQEALVESGASKTLDSRHLTGHAVDLGALLNGKVSWHWSLYHQVARSMQTAARSLDIEIRWGGVWDRTLNSLSDDLEDEVAQYVARRRVNGNRAFLDGPHFELPKARYP